MCELTIIEAIAASIAAYLYVSPAVIQDYELNIFTTIAITNTTEYWFNPRIFVLDSNGETIYNCAPLLHGRGTWQKASSDLIQDDFKGSIWIVSEQPIEAVTYIHQRDGNKLTLLGAYQMKEQK